MRTGGAVDHQGLPADGLEGADRAVDAAHEQLLGLAKNLLRTASRTMCHWIPSANDFKGAGETPALQRWFPNHRRAAAIQIRFFAPPWPSRLTRLEPPGGIFGVVSEHDIRSGAPDSGQDFQHH